jgi:hypothetical protein
LDSFLHISTGGSSNVIVLVRLLYFKKNTSLTSNGAY